MEVTVLVILYRGREHISLHDNEKLAWSRLVKFVEEGWPGVLETTASDSEEHRVDLFFGDPGDSYVIGNADVSELEGCIDAAMKE